MNNNEKIFIYLDKLFPNAKCELHYKKDYELLIAVMLSAQTTDKRVNQVTPLLFERFPSLEALSKANLEEIKQIIAPLGMINVKGKNIIAIAKGLIDNFQGVVPFEKEKLMSLAGVGNKTANVVRAELFNIPEIAVDTHVARIAKRLGFANEQDNVSIIEMKLRKAIPVERYIKTHHQFIHFGRYKCKAIHPICDDCEIKEICHWASNHK